MMGSATKVCIIAVTGYYRKGSLMIFCWDLFRFLRSYIDWRPFGFIYIVLFVCVKFCWFVFTATTCFAC